MEHWAGDIQPSPQMRFVAVARIPFIDQASKQGIGHRPISQGLGSCRKNFMMDMHVDVHISKRTQHATRVIAFDQAQFGKHLHIFVHALDIAANSSRQFSHR